MNDAFEELMRRAETAPVTWCPDQEPKDAPLAFEDNMVAGLGPDPTGAGFEKIAASMLGGNFYPPDAVIFEGRFKREARRLRKGDRIVQTFPLLGKLGGPTLHACVEVYVAERDENRCQLGYVTTAFHFARGIWTATLTRTDDDLELEIESTTCPSSFLYWTGLPIARLLQLRARRRAIEEIRGLLRSG